MHLHPHLADRQRRTRAVMEILRQRAEFLRARGQAVPPALRQAMDDYDRYGRLPHHADPR